MSRNRVHIEVPREEVFAVLADAERYPDWVVGAANVEEHDDEIRPPPSPTAWRPRSSAWRPGSGR